MSQSSNGAVASVVLHADFETRILTAEDSLNVAMKDITVTARDGKQSKLETVYIRGSMIR